MSRPDAGLTDAIPCLALTFSDSEIEEVYGMLEEDGYEPSTTGLKQFILDAARDGVEEREQSATDRVGEKVAGYIRDNPDKVRQGVTLAQAVGHALVDKLMQKRR